jgi:Transglutaminase-like superfamily
MPRTPIRALCALVAILRASLRVARIERRVGLPELVSRLRATGRPRGALDSALRTDPALPLCLLERMLPVLPPFGAGRCLKRSLLLLDLWSRAGLSPCLHLGVRGGQTGCDGGSRGHAWVSTTSSAFRTLQSEGVVEAWRA